MKTNRYFFAWTKGLLGMAWCLFSGIAFSCEPAVIDDYRYIQQDNQVIVYPS